MLTLSKSKKKDNLILILLSSVLVFVDWRLNSLFTFSDITLLIAVFFILFRNGMKISTKQVLVYISLIIIVLINISANMLTSSNFVVVEGLKGLIKVTFYAFSIIQIYNYVKQKSLDYQLLVIIEKVALIICFIGFYIFISLQLGGILPYEILWKFTRTDLASYTYGGLTNIIRMRSIFAEPAHFGYFMNSVLAVSYFNNFGFKTSRREERIFIISLILSFSMASIIVFIAIKILDLIRSGNMISFLKKKSTIVGMAILSIVLVVMQDVVKTTLITRVGRIMSGQDSSASIRVFGSWSHVSFDNLILGEGLGNSPILFNNYAYVLTDFGIVTLVLFIIFSLMLVKNNFYLGITFIILNFAKGGYLGPGYWVLLLLIFIYSENKKNISYRKSTNE